MSSNGLLVYSDTEKCFCEDKALSESEHEQEEERRKTSIKWADWAGGRQLQQVQQETVWLDEETDENSVVDFIQENQDSGNFETCDTLLPPVTLSQVKIDVSKSCVVGVIPTSGSAEHDSLVLPEEDEREIGQQLPDTIEAHFEILRERESKLKMKETIQDQDNPFRPEGELSKEAELIVGAIKEGGKGAAITPPLAHSPPIPSLSPSSPQPVEADSKVDSPDGGVDRALTQEYQTSPSTGAKEAAEVKVERSVIVTSKTDDVEHVVIPEKSTSCCPCSLM